MTEKHFEYKSGVKSIYRHSDLLDTSNCDWVTCVWRCAVVITPNSHILRFSWKFNWKKRKKGGTNRLTGYIIMKPNDLYEEDDEFMDYQYERIDVDLIENGQTIEYELDTHLKYPHYRARFKYHLTPNDDPIGEANKPIKKKKMVLLKVKADKVPVKKVEKMVSIVKKDRIENDNGHLNDLNYDFNKKLNLEGEKVDKCESNSQYPCHSSNKETSKNMDSNIEKSEMVPKVEDEKKIPVHKIEIPITSKVVDKKKQLEYKSDVKTITEKSNILDMGMENGLTWSWSCETTYDYDNECDILRFLWKFNWDELKKKGIKRLSGYIIVKPPDDEDYNEYWDDFQEEKINIELTYFHENIEKSISTNYARYHYLVVFEYFLTPHC